MNYFKFINFKINIMKVRRLLFYLLILVVFNTNPVTGREIHVSKKGSDSNDGSSSTPLKTISAAARLAFPGDTITVQEGTYREWVNPL